MAREITLYLFVIGVNLVGLCLATAAIFTLRAVAKTAPTARLALAWNVLAATIFLCVALRAVATMIRHHSELHADDLLDAIAHLLGPAFVFAVAWLSHDTTKSLLRATINEQAALTDLLTGLPNRRNFEAARSKAIAQARRKRQSLHLVLLDIDHFKHINDRYGHTAGDAVLQQFATVIGGVLREGDIAYRIGGEEFAVIISDLPPDEAPAVVDRLRRAVAVAPIHAGDRQPINITVSIGGALLTDEDTPETLFRRADIELYSAKNDGRNLTRLAA